MADIPADTPGAPDFSITAQPSNPDPVRLLYQAPTTSSSPTAGQAQSVAPPTTPATSPSPDNTPYLIINGQQLTGWQAFEVIRGIEVFPASFSATLTELYPSPANQVIAKAGDFCQIFIGTTLVLTGRVDRVAPAISSGLHQVQIIGRSLGRELVDCTIDWTKVEGLQINNGTMLSVAQQLASPYGVPVKVLSSGKNVPIPQLNLNLTDTPYAVVERLARAEGLLVYDDVDGSLVLNVVGSQTMVSGIVEGVNVEAASGMFSMDQRYKYIDVFTMGSYTTSDLVALAPVTEVPDLTVPNYRRLAVICETVMQGSNVAEQRGLWEVARRYGRSQALRVTVDNWRDSSGTLWTPNFLVPVTVPHCKIVGLTWIISEVRFRRDQSGTHADLVLMPPQAFFPEPTILTPFDPQLYYASQQPAAPAAPQPTAAQPMLSYQPRPAGGPNS